MRVRLLGGVVDVCIWVSRSSRAEWVCRGYMCRARCGRVERQECFGGPSLAQKCTSGAWQGAEVQDACVCWSLSANEFANLTRCRSNSPWSSLRLQLLAHPILSELHNGDLRSRSTTNNIRPHWLTPRLWEVIAFGHALLHIALDRTCRLPSHASVTVRRRQGASCAVQRARFCRR